VESVIPGIIKLTGNGSEETSMVAVAVPGQEVL